MESFLPGILAEKILTGIESPPNRLTRRDATFPTIPGKALSVIGMRRAGKTCYLHQIRSDLMASGGKPECLVYFNFEDERLAGMEAGDLDRIPSTHRRLFPELADSRISLFLDEIQLVAGWERFVRRLLDEDRTDLFLSGSSAKLLSREIATSMRGRGWERVIQPFSFREFLRHHEIEIPEHPDRLTDRKKAVMEGHFRAFLECGGFPEAQNLKTPQRRQLIQSYIDVLLLRDVIERHGVTNVTALRWMTRRLLGNPGGLFSITKFEAELKSQGVAVGRETLYELLAHLEDTFLLRAIPVATDSEKRRQVNPRKVYPIDPAIGPVFDRSRKQNLGHALEVAVHNELTRRGADTAYIKTSEGFEVDFLSRSADGSECLVQVCADLSNPDTLEREVRALQTAAVSCSAERLLITADSQKPALPIPSDIRHLPAWQWMLTASPSHQ